NAMASPVVFAMLEQLPFAAAREREQPVLKALGRLLPLFLGLSATAGESRPLLELVFSKMVPHLADSKGKLAKAGVPVGLEFEFNAWLLESETVAETQTSALAALLEQEEQPADRPE